MRCPKCYSKLITEHQLPLETLLEHVSDPNGTPCLKDAYHCANHKCELYVIAIWDEWGDSYGFKGEALFSHAWKYHTYKKHWNKYISGPLIRLRFRIFGPTKRQKELGLFK